MTKLASKIATGLAVLALAAPAFAVTQSTAGSGGAQTSTPSKAHHRAHKRVAQADSAKSGAATKSDAASSGSAAKPDAKATAKAKSTKKHAHSKKSQEKAPAASEAPAAPSAPAPAPAK